MLIERIDTPDPSVKKSILDAIVAYNDATIGHDEPVQNFACVVRDADGAIAGGLIATSYYDWMHVDLLYLPEPARRGGLGRRMMRAAEHEAARIGCTGIWLDTGSFQAPGFYKKLGFQVFGQIHPFARDATRFYLYRRNPQPGTPDQTGFEIMREPDPAAEAAILSALNAYNDSHVGPPNRHVFALVARDHADGPIRGGLYGVFSRFWLFVELLVLPEEARRQNLGTALMRQAEDIARERGGIGVFLDTFSFQARPFYERLGYTVFGEIPDFPAPHSRFFLARRLDRAPP